MHRIGIMQGRLVPPADSRIQAFPADRWREEFSGARQAGLDAIEWIFDAGEDGNPLATDEGLAEMQKLGAAHGVGVESLCADYFLPEPLLKGTAGQRAKRADTLSWLLTRCQTAGIRRVVLPFVDNSRIESSGEISALASLLPSLLQNETNRGMELHLETDLPAEKFTDLLDRINHPAVKVNYDSGNSASLGFDADEEFAAYGDRIGSVHIKDRVRGGGTVPLGCGDADFSKLMKNLKRMNYRGDFVLQVARNPHLDEILWARQNRGFLHQVLGKYF